MLALLCIPSSPVPATRDSISNSTTLRCVTPSALKWPCPLRTIVLDRGAPVPRPTFLFLIYLPLSLPRPPWPLPPSPCPIPQPAEELGTGGDAAPEPPTADPYATATTASSPSWWPAGLSLPLRELHLPCTPALLMLLHLPAPALANLKVLDLQMILAGYATGRPLAGTGRLVAALQVSSWRAHVCAIRCVLAWRGAPWTLSSQASAAHMRCCWRRGRWRVC